MIMRYLRFLHAAYSIVQNSIWVLREIKSNLLRWWNIYGKVYNSIQPSGKVKSLFSYICWFKLFTCTAMVRFKIQSNIWKF